MAKSPQLGKIGLRPVGNIDNRTLGELQDSLQQTFGCMAGIGTQIDLPPHAYDPKRKQYSSAALLSTMSALGIEDAERILGVTDVDLYVSGLNFVFGQANPGARAAIISLCRLKQEYYALPQDERLFVGRATKEAIHELGHTYGLGHCQDAKCVMYFSNSLVDTDRKQAAFCKQCLRKLKH